MVGLAAESNWPEQRAWSGYCVLRASSVSAAAAVRRLKAPDRDARSPFGGGIHAAAWLPVKRSQAMSETILEAFELFFVGLPPAVRNDLAFMMVALFDENLLIVEVEDVYEHAGWGLFKAETRIGRIGKLINAVSVCDVYFAMDARERYLGSIAKPRNESSVRKARLDYYARQIDDIRRAKQHWVELRRTTLTHEAIAAALIPPGPSRKQNRRYVVSSFGAGESQEASHDTVS